MEKTVNKLNEIRTPYIWINPRLCRMCGRCISVCPKRIIGKAGFFWRKYLIIKNAEICIGCQKCIKVCPCGVFSEEKFIN